MYPQAVLFGLDNTLTHRQRSIEAYAALFARHYEAHLGINALHLISSVISAQDNGGYLAVDSAQATIKDAVAAGLRGELDWLTSVPAAELAIHWADHFPTQSIEMPGATRSSKRWSNGA